MINLKHNIIPGANAFKQGFIKGAKETPRAFFSPAIAIWRLLMTTTESLIK